MNDEQQQQAFVTVEGVEYEIPEKLTFGDLADIEEITGQAYNPKKSGPRMMLALTYIAMRRRNPQLTIDDIRDLDFELIDFPDRGEKAGPPAEAPVAPTEETGDESTGTPS